MLRCVHIVCILHTLLSASTINASNGIVKPDDLGVKLFHLAGPLLLNDSNQFVTTSTTYFKAIPTDYGSFDVRALVFMYDPVDMQLSRVADKWDIHMLPITPKLSWLAEQPTFSLLLTPQLGNSSSELRHWRLDPAPLATVSPFHEILEQEPAPRYRFQVPEWYYTAMLPYAVRGVVTGDAIEAASSVLFSVNCPHLGAVQPCWQHKGLVTSDTFDARRELLFPVKERPRFVSVVKPITTNNVPGLAQLLYARCHYLSAIGVQTTLLYDRGALTGPLQRDPVAAQLMQDGLLHIMMFTHQESGLPQPYYPDATEADKKRWAKNSDQWVVYSHAALALWGTNSYMFIADMDEFPLLPPQVTLQHVFGENGCLQDVAYVHLERRNMFCGSKAAEAAAAVDQAAAQQLQQQLAADREWVQHSSCKQNSDVTAIHAMLTCSLIEQGTEYPKLMVHANAGAHFHPHDGFVYPEYKDRALSYIQDTCLSVIHLWNLMSDRDIPEEPVRLAGNWTWPIMESLSQQRSSC